MSKTASVQQLLAAEKKAAEIVDAAKKARVNKLKKARTDAEAEVAAFRQKRQAAFDQFVAEQSSSGDSGSAAVVLQADMEITALQGKAKANVDKVSSVLVQLVSKVSLTDPKPSGEIDLFL
eukprot:EG_transcript_36488